MSEPLGPDDVKRIKALAKSVESRMCSKEDQLYMAVELKFFDQLLELSERGRNGGPESEWFLAGVCAHLVMCEILRRQMERGIDQIEEKP